VRRKRVIDELRRKAAWLDRKIAETVPGTPKHNALRAEFCAVDYAARELEGRASQREVASVLMRITQGLKFSPSKVSNEDIAFLWAWASVVIADEEHAKAEKEDQHAGSSKGAE
jgi:hypothetical protein